MDRKKLAQAEAIVGGRYKLTTLLQKRVRELVRGAPKLIQTDSRNFMEIALHEILDRKVELVPPEEGEKTAELGGASEETETDLAVQARGT